VRHVTRSACPVRLPDGADGAAVYAITDIRGAGYAVQLEPLRGCHRWPWPNGTTRKTYGLPNGHAFRIQSDECAGRAVCEGVADALALHWRYGLTVAAMMGTSGIRTYRGDGSELLFFDPDGPGKSAAIQATGVRTIELPEKGDPADAIRAELDERAAIMEDETAAYQRLEWRPEELAKPPVAETETCQHERKMA